MTLSSTHRRAVVLAAAVVGVLVTARLGWWQLDRAGQKLAMQANLAQRQSMPALAADALARDPQAAVLQHYRRISVQGRWLPERTIHLDNRQMNGRTGFFVVTPLVLPAGDAVLVVRGWVPRNFVDRQALAPVPTPPGMVTVTGRIAPPPAKLFSFSSAEQGAIRQNLDPSGYAQETGLSLRPLSILQLDVDGATGPADGLMRQWAPPALDVGKHHGYAFQWFALCALIAGLTVWFQLIRPRVRSRLDQPA